ncbi:inverse autotransporter beta domain-containing protein [Xenorhabdus lircayensis]|uniref:Inverse autotransporter beta domain-containing protein n=1 Tax=Xenorhabdus lircayensis TaxID=2763499 RepID=A0ABS0U878_9GAMM|nr:inverse autotransporter beta domain-containing protein [Xenorhabdus lircayensis]MBI6549173.1 inverse autotransporter beta domain-containing protein [Xenorhabdus lircayensis]
MLKKQSRLWTDKQHHLLKWVVWVNIFAQIAFPVVGAFTPTVAVAKTPTIAQESRPLSKPFTELGEGDEIDVPKSSPSKPLAESLSQASANESPENATERWLANAASRAAGVLKSGNMVDSVKNQLHGMALSEANQAVRNWLQRYGTIKLQANVDNRGRLDGSQFDMLLPLYDTEKQMAFTQFGLRRIDSRTTANLGLGQRHFFDTSMFGYNAFLDHDITRDHTRFGIGAEYARDFMKFGANGYFRVSGWKEGKKLKDYEERPANGFDLRAEGYVPIYPELGGKLVYEQYFGDEVGLLSEERRQKNPSVFTVGANYTPIPLVTLGIDRKQSAQGHGETQFNFGLNYELGTPWSKQIDPDAVAFKRSLQGGRYDLVERNNQIVLEYRKKELVHLMMGDRIKGHGGEVIPLNVSVSAKHGLKEIVWDTANLVAGGGKLEKLDEQSVHGETRSLFKSAVVLPVRGGTHYVLTLPPYHNKGNNAYALSGVAYDNQGNASERAETQIQVIPLSIDLKGSGFEPPRTSMVADGKIQTVIRLKLIDKDGKAVSRAVGHIILIPDLSGLKGEGKNPELGTEIKEVPEGSGIYEVIATAGTRHGKWAIRAKVDGYELPSAVVDFYLSLAEMVDTEKSQFKVSKESVFESDESGSFQLDLFDKSGSIITGVADHFTLEINDSELYGEGKKPTIGEVKEVPPDSGHYEWPFKGEDTQGRLSVTAIVDGQKIKTVNVIFGNVLADIISETYSTFNVDSTTLEADGQQQTTLALVLKDTQNNPIPNIQPRLRFTGSGLSGSGDDPTIEAIQEDPAHSGTYTAKVTAGTKTGAWAVTPQVDGKVLSKIAVKVTFNPPLADVVSETRSTFSADPNMLEADNQQQATLKLVLKDGQNNPMPNIQPRLRFTGSGLSGSGDDPTIEAIQEDPAHSGTYTAKVTAGTKTGAWTVTPQVDGKVLSKIAVKVTFNPPLADVVSETHSTFSADPNMLEADNQQQATLKLVLKDSQNNPMPKIQPRLRFTGSALSGSGDDPTIEAIQEDPAHSGTYTANVTAGTKTGAWTVTPQVDGKVLSKIAVKVTFNPPLADVVSETHSTFSADPNMLEADNQQQATLKLVLKDSQNNPMPNIQPRLRFTGSALSGSGDDPTIEAIQEDPAHSGTYTAKVTVGTKTGAWTVTPQVDGKVLSKIAVKVTFNPPLADVVSETHSTFSADPNMLEADNQQQATLKLVLKDSQNNPMPNIQPRLRFTGSALSGNGDDPKIEAIQEDPAHSGTYTAKVTVGTKTGAWTVTPQVDGKVLSKIAVKVMFNPPTAPTIRNLKLKVDNQKMLVVGETLQVEYVYEHSGGNKIDSSVYAWGEEGKTVAAVEELANAGINGANSNLQSNSGGLVKGIVNNGKIQDYLIIEEHAGKVLEFSILARNGLDIRAKDILTLTTNDSKNQGNDTVSKIPGGRVANFADAVEVKLDAQGKGDTVTIGNNPVVRLRARANLTPNADIDSAQLTVTPKKYGKSVAWVPVAINMSGLNRQGNQVQQTDVKTMLDGQEGSFTGYTDQTGQLVMTVSDPNGIGIRTTLKAVADGATVPIEEETDIIFTVITSPDVKEANYWGHMFEWIQVGAIYFQRSYLYKEVSSSTSQQISPARETNEDWVLGVNYFAEEVCQQVRMRMPRIEELEALGNQVPVGKNEFTNKYGWPTHSQFAYYRSSSSPPDSGGIIKYHDNYTYDLTTKQTHVNGVDDRRMVSCVYE